MFSFLKPQSAKKFQSLLKCTLLASLTFSLSSCSSLARKDQGGNKRTSTGDTVQIVPKSAWNGVPGRPYKTQTPVRITVHHEGGRVLTASDDAKQRLKNVQSWSMGPDRNWKDIPYHLLIAPDGTVYEGRNPLTVGETNTEYDPTGHLLISFLGNYTEQKLDDRLLKVLINLLSDSCIKYNISPSEISTHRDHSKKTTCPGEDIYSYFKSGYIVAEVSKQVDARLKSR